MILPCLLPSSCLHGAQQCEHGVLFAITSKQKTTMKIVKILALAAIATAFGAAVSCCPQASASKAPAYVAPAK